MGLFGGGGGFGSGSPFGGFGGGGFSGSDGSNLPGGNLFSGILENITGPFTEPNKLREAGNESARPENQVYDPFAAQRPGYQAQLSTLMNDPSSITTMPGYDAGLQAIMRKLASQGYLGSGKMMESLFQFGGNFYNDAVKNLTQLAGGNFAPTKTDSSGKLKGEEDAAGMFRHNQDIWNDWSKMGMSMFGMGGIGG